jgi:uracil-DNA glycosylase family 4
MQPDNGRERLIALLDWYRSMGIDVALDEAPTDWLARGSPPPGAQFQWPAREAAASAPFLQPAPHPVRATRSFQKTHTIELPPETAPRPQTPLAPSAAETEARQIARHAGTLDALEAALRGFDGCALKATAKNLCFYRGAPKAPLMLIGEAPGRDEDLEGKPFVGRAGQLLDKMLAAIGLNETGVHITNIVYWRPPGNRTPTPQEALACRPFLERQIELVAPRIILALGGAAAKEIFGVSEGIMRLRGRWREMAIGARKIPVMATLHPAYLLRTPAAKQPAWQDLLAVKARLSSTED